jgi:tetratricopeptide (TPR) repeat protein
MTPRFTINRLIYIVSFFISLSLHGQNLKNSEWIRVISERQDGSRIIDRTNSLLTKPVRYSFQDSDLIISYDGEFKSNYTITQKTLTVGKIINNRFEAIERFKIDTLSDILLVLSQISDEKQPKDRANTYTFVRSKYYLQYLISNRKIEISNDTIIECNKLLFPYYQGNIDMDLTSVLSSSFTKNGTAIGSIIFTPDGKINQLKISNTENLLTNQVKKLEESILQTNGKWKFPIPSNTRYFKLYFICYFYRQGNMFPNGVSIAYNSNDISNFVYTPLLPEEIQKSSQYFNRGTKLLSQNKNQKAILEFEKSLDIDSLNIDCLYNKAYAHYKLNESKLACETWIKLVTLGQKQAEIFIKESCR